jgi:tetratricopeptide (TPR) repeat protein
MSDPLMNLKKYILIALLCIFALLGVVWQFFGIPFLPNRQELALRQQMMIQRWVEVITRKATAEPILQDPFATLTPEESYDRSIEMLSAGRQIEAEEIIAGAVKNNLDDADLIFAKAVLERSRWGKYTSELWFGLARRKGFHTYIAEAAALQMHLDSRKATESDLRDLIQLSDAHPDDIYLLWLSAIQCREQKNGPLGRERYEKLLAKFTVGPVLLHQTYANILSEILGDHESALKHRYIAVSLEAKGWSLQGLANTLTYLGRYDEACAVWARTVQVAPNDSDYWGGWGWTLRRAERYEEALEKHREAFRLDPASGYDAYSSGFCLEKLKRYAEMAEFYRQAAELNHPDGLRAFGWCYETGRGVSKNMKTAVYWYKKAADRGQTRALNDLAMLSERGEELQKSYAKAVEYYLKALEINPANSQVLNNYAWLLTTCEDESFRNYPKAVDLAERSAEIEADIHNLDTLAVAYAHNGQPGQAVEAQRRMMDFWSSNHPGKPLPKYMTDRLAEFEQKAAEAGAPHGNRSDTQ